MRTGHTLFATAAASLTEQEFSAPSTLPGWTRKHLVAHVAANADALANLVHWAATGIPTPMYASSEERSAGIEKGTAMTGAELTDWLLTSARSLENAMSRLTEPQWNHEVVTVQGRTIPATELPWLRAREACVHVVDLDVGTGFADLPEDFLTVFCEEVVDKRAASGAGPAVALEAVASTGHGEHWTLPGDGDGTAQAAASPLVSGPLAEVAAYLTGRAHRLTTADGTPVPELPAWL
jgi:maleylpyruvate isomerase